MKLGLPAANPKAFDKRRLLILDGFLFSLHLCLTVCTTMKYLYCKLKLN